MNTTELLAIFRDEMADTVPDYLWSDALVYGYMDDAQKQFCRDAYGIEDARSYSIATAAGSEWYAMDSKILELRGVVDSRGCTIPVHTAPQARFRGVRFDGVSGRPQCFVKGMQRGYLRAYPIPTSSDTGTYRLETLRLSEDIGAGDDFEIEDHHHRNLLSWVKYRAYSKHDAETFNAAKAAEFRTEFALYCQEARIEYGRLSRNVAVVQFQGV